MARVSFHPFAARVVAWQRTHGRHGLPWQGTADAYRIWVSEIMLQQTQVSVVLGYYERFMARFPDVAALAAAPLDEVLALWSGLGYYARARNLHRAANEVMLRFAGTFPTRFDDLHALPGIGRSTAGAIAAFATGARHAILDGNVRRVLARHAGIGGDPASAATQARLWAEAEARTPDHDLRAYTQGMMDLGADVCALRRPACLVCPVSADCTARAQDRVDELPARRARPEAPRRRVAMLAIRSADALLLEKRPAAGIWGGLWSLPEVPTDADVHAALLERWGLRAREMRAMEPIAHAFTHFTLEIAPVLVGIAAPVREVVAPCAWHPFAGTSALGLPAPVRRLLARVAEAAA